MSSYGKGHWAPRNLGMREIILRISHEIDREWIRAEGSKSTERHRLSLTHSILIREVGFQWQQSRVAWET